MKLNKIIALAALLSSGVANAASLENAEGDVRVNQGKGFTSVQGSVELAPGDKIKLGRKSGALLVYPDGCSEKLSANSLAAVAKHSPCSYKAIVETPAGPINNSPFDPVGGDFWPVAGGVVLVGGVTAAIAVATSSSQSSQTPFLLPVPTSP